MKWDVKACMIFVFVILIYGFSYVFSHGSFAFPLAYNDLVLALFSFVFLFKTPFSKYSIVMILFGLSFTYQLFGVYVMENNLPTIFMVIRDVTILMFAVFLFIRVIRNKSSKFRGIFLFFGLIVLAQMVFNGINFSMAQASSPVADLIKNLIVIVLAIVLVRQVKEGDPVLLSIKRIFLLMGLFAFRNSIWLLIDGDLM